MTILNQATTAKAPDCHWSSDFLYGRAQNFQTCGVRKQSKRALLILPHESREVQCISEGPKSAESARQLHRLIQIAKGLGQQLTVVVFEGESVTPKCLLNANCTRTWLSHGTCSTLLAKPKWGSNTAYFSVLFASMLQTTPPHFWITSWLATIGAVSPAVCV